MIREITLQLIAWGLVFGASGACALSRDPPPHAVASTRAAADYGKERQAKLLAAAPDVAPGVLALALRAGACAVRSGAVPRLSRLGVIDYSRPSTERRLWVFDLASDTLLFDEHVAHGRATGDNMARAFSNIDGSLQSSLGLFRTGETYVGGNGYSLNLDGLEPGVNDRARDRRIVMHGAAYVDPQLALRQGRLGRSHGCPALRSAVAARVIDTLKDGQLLFAFYPDQDWLANSQFLDCDGQQVSGKAALPAGSPGRG